MVIRSFKHNSKDGVITFYIDKDREFYSVKIEKIDKDVSVPEILGWVDHWTEEDKVILSDFISSCTAIIKSSN